MSSGVQRKSNIELLRILLMLMIISGHIFPYAERIDSVGTIDYSIIHFIRSFDTIAVNTFVIITGYFGTKCNWKKIISLDLKTCVYIWTGFIVSLLMGIHQFNAVKDIKYLFPVLTKQYWFVTAYIVLSILSPFLNKFLESSDKNDLKRFLITSGIIFYGVATFCWLINAEQIVNDAGYGVVNFIYLYCAGYYLRHHYKNKNKSFVWLIICILSCVAAFIANYAMSLLMGFHFDSLISYNSVFVLIGAMGLFMFFSNIDLGEIRIVNFFSKHALAVYLIHYNPLMRDFLFKNVFGLENIGGWRMIVGVLAIPIIVYLCSSLIDFVVDIILNPICSFLYSKFFSKHLKEM